MVQELYTRTKQNREKGNTAKITIHRAITHILLLGPWIYSIHLSIEKKKSFQQIVQNINGHSPFPQINEDNLARILLTSTFSTS